MSSVDSTQSSTFSEITPGGFSITYGDGSNKHGDYISDNLEIGGVTIQGLEMGYALGGSSSDGWGILGVGFDALEQTSDKYPNIIDDMVSQGYIDSPFYSVWLDDLRKLETSNPSIHTQALSRLPDLRLTIFLF